MTASKESVRGVRGGEVLAKHLWSHRCAAANNAKKSRLEGCYIYVSDADQEEEEELDRYLGWSNETSSKKCKTSFISCDLII